MKTKSRLLGLAFASADALIELDGDRAIAFAMGATPCAHGASLDGWVGQPLGEVLGRASVGVVEAALAGLRPGIRSEALDVLVKCDAQMVRRAHLRAFCLPDLAPAVSCAIAYVGAPFSLALPSPPPMLDAELFLARARDSVMHAEAPLALAFIDVPGLDQPRDEASRRAAVRVEAALQAASIDGNSAGRLAPERFALLRPVDDIRDLTEEVREAGAAEGLEVAVEATTTTLPVDQPVNVLRALRYAVEGCLKNDGLANPGVAFADSLKRTLRDAERFRQTVRSREFSLHYQPIVDLRTDAVHHFEALARFEGRGPAAVVHMAEELGLVAEFDIAVLEKAIQQMRRPGSGLIRIAVNVSGASMASDAYVDAVLRLTANTPDDRRRLMVEVTETVALADPAAAERRLKRLRDAGVKVCIDDFGAGAASFDYLNRLTVDVVKIDGSLIVDLADNARSRTLVDHIARMCADLGVATIAEKVETEAVADALRGLGVSYGQGWLFGRAAPEPVVARPKEAVARRVGAVKAWG